MRLSRYRAHKRSDEGFSLIELMVVMVIIGLMTGAAVVLLSGEKDQTFEQAERIAATLTALSRESVVSGTVIGVKIERQALLVKKMTTDGWAAGDVQSTQAPQFLEAAQLILAGTPVKSASPSENDAQNVFVPQIWFLPTGEFPAFEIMALAGGNRITVSGVPGNHIKATINE